VFDAGLPYEAQAWGLRLVAGRPCLAGKRPDDQHRCYDLRRLAGNTRYRDVRERLLRMAAGFDRLADQVENWENTPLATAAD
jgi:hypothetical protein